MIGDKMSDLLAGHRANIGRLILVEGKYPIEDASFNYEVYKRLQDINC